MTRVCARRQEGRFLLSASGHATGSVPVCAAVSALVFSLALFVERASGEGRAAWTQRRLEDGDARLEWTGLTDSDTAFELVVNGLRMIADRFPTYLHVETRGECK